MSDLVTGDAVVLGLTPARLPSRALALCVDLVLAWAVYLLLTLVLLTGTAHLDAAALAAVQVGLFVLVLVGGLVAVETLSGGRSLGKLACGLRVVQVDGGPIRFRHVLVRQAVGVVELQASFGVLAAAASLLSARGRRVGDVFAGTLVVRERVPAALTAPALPPSPPWLAGQLGGLDLSQVPDGLWLSVRQYLLRADQLDQAVARSLAERLAADMAACTGSPVPQGAPAGAYLAGLVAERQARESRRAFGAAPAATPTETVRQPAMGEPAGTAAGAAPTAAAEPDDRNAGAPAPAPAPEPEPVPATEPGAEPAPTRRSEEGRSETPRTGFVPPA